MGNQAHREQDRVMRLAASDFCVYGRPAALEEFQEHRIDNLPPTNTSGFFITFVGESSDVGLNDALYSPHGGLANCKWGVGGGGELDGSTPLEKLFNGRRSLICVVAATTPT